MRKLLFVCWFIFLGTVPARAEENRGIEVSGDYPYARFSPGSGLPASTVKVVQARFGAYLTARAGIVGEFGACKVTGLPSGASAH